MFNCAEKGIHIKNIIPSAGFCERTEIFNGQKPNESGFFTAIGFDPDESPYKNMHILNYLGKLEWIVKSTLTILPKEFRYKVYWVLRRILLKISFNRDVENKILKPYSIPLSFLKYFDLTEDKFDFFNNSINHNKSVFHEIVKLGGRVFTESFTSLRMTFNDTDSGNIQKAINAHKNDNYVFYPIYLGEIDQIGHIYGPKSRELNSAINKTDQIIKKAVNEFLKEDICTKFIFLGDHGMTEVKAIIDIESIIKNISNNLKLAIGHDFVYFLDSTMFRLWFIRQDSKKSFINELLTNPLLLKNGVFVDKKVANDYSIPVNDRRYGDILWWANTGVLVFPDFFHTDVPYKGMHGYMPNSESTYGTCVVWGRNISPKIIEKMDLVHINRLLKEVISL